mmetsp:Transcript_16458/g.19749  ORF Transcript_16458/g.19749 Transcript_16458/m.19749 type:complete len:216 (+) Transcript_16458:443-1090(+)
MCEPLCAVTTLTSFGLDFSAITSSAEGIFSKDCADFLSLVFLELRALSDAVTKTATICTSSCSCKLVGFVVQIHRVIHVSKCRRNTLLCLLEQMLEVEQHGLGLVAVEECGCNSCLPTTACTTDAMDIVFNLLRHVKVDDVFDVWEVKTFRCHISSNQDVFLLSFEGIYSVFSLLLVQPTVYRHCLHTFEQEIFMNLVHVNLVLTEHKHRRRCLL